jgi:hypothetical protein
MTADQPQWQGIARRNRFFVWRMIIRSFLLAVALALAGLSAARGRWVALAAEGLAALLAFLWVDHLRRTYKRTYNKPNNE